MNSSTTSGGSYAIIYNPSLMQQPGVDFFDIESWRDRNAISGEAVGRGSAWFLQAPQGALVLRHYLRGGWAARLSRQKYFFNGATRSRPFKEYRVTAALAEAGLPVAEPVAAICEFDGWTYSGAIVTVAIPSAQTFADCLERESKAAEADAGLWEAVGQCVRRFHEAGLWHADLNARNILFDAHGQVHLIDFDRARFTATEAVNGRGNLKRLKRSVAKFWPADMQPGLETGWQRLLAAYNG